MVMRIIRRAENGLGSAMFCLVCDNQSLELKVDM